MKHQRDVFKNAQRILFLTLQTIQRGTAVKDAQSEHTPNK